MERRWFELLMDDHTMTEKVFAAAELAFADEAGPSPELVADVLSYVTVYVDRCHSLKEENHLFPLIQERGIPAAGGPLAVMLGEHEEQRRLLAELVPAGEAFVAGEAASLAAFQAIFGRYAALCKEHFWKENDILYPMARRVMSEEDEARVIRGIEATEAELGEGARERYYALAEKLAASSGVKDLSLSVDREVMACVLNTLPVELSFVDADDVVQYFNREDLDKIFPRQRSAIGTKVQDCHPQGSVHLVNRILREFKAGKREVAEFWIDFGGKMVHIRYFPVRDRSGRYLGCMETVQDVTHIRSLQGERRLLDEA